MRKSFTSPKPRRSLTILTLLALLPTLLIAFPFRNPSYAADWKEEFDDPVLDSSVWEVQQNSGKVVLSNSWLLLSSEGNTFPYIYLKNPLVVNAPECSLKIKLRYINITHWGTGISIGNSIISNGLPIGEYDPRGENGDSVRIWTELMGDLRIVYRNCQNKPCELTKLYSAQHDTLTHFFRMDIASNGEASIFWDDSFIAKVILPTDFNIWMGNPLLMPNPGSWTQFGVDYLLYSCKSIKTPLVLIPGLGASWNTEAIILGRNKPQSEWKMTPFVNIYDNLIGALKNAGYQEGKDLFVFNYDWRRPVTQTAAQLNQFLEEKGVSKTILIGHSLGGLVSRAYQQDHQSKVEKIITLGTPHKGAVQAYEALAGGKVSQKPVSWESVALGLLLAMRGSHYRTGADLLRQEVPVLYNLVPTFDFAKKRRKTIPSDSLSFKNTWLKQANSQIPSNLYFISGNTGKNTPEWLYLRSPTLIDRLLNLWPDGKPYRTIKGVGDQTVLLKSSYLGSSPQAVFAINHRQLPSERQVIQKILEEIPATSSFIPTNSPYPIDNTLIFAIASPATLQVITPQQQVINSDEQGFVIIPYPSEGEYQAQLKGKERGRYHLIVGQLFNQMVWNIYEGEIKKDQEVSFVFQIDPQYPAPNPLQSPKEVLKAALRQIKILNKDYLDSNLNSASNFVVEAIKQIDSHNLSKAEVQTTKAIQKLFLFRKGHKQTEVLNRTQNTISLLTLARGMLLKEAGVSRSKAYLSYRKSLRGKSFAWRIIRIRSRRKKADEKLLLSYQSGIDLFNKSRKYLKEKKYNLSLSYADSALKFFKEVK